MPPMPSPPSRDTADLEATTGSFPVRPSTVTLPQRRPDGVATLLDFFLARFPRVPEAVWRERFAAGKVWSEAGAVAADDAFVPRLRLCYRREVEREPPVRTDFRVVSADDHLVVVDKPPQLPVTPGGPWVRRCLLHLLGEAMGEEELVPLHRLDRLTSGLVVLSRARASRAHFARLFQAGAPTEKIYTAVCEVRSGSAPRSAMLEHRLARSPDAYWRQVVVAGAATTAVTEIELLDEAGALALYRVRPHTGRKHQIRVQLAAVGLPILGDPLYGSRPFHDPEDLTTRMWLDAHRLCVAGFPRPDGGGTLTAEWSSSRAPAAMLARAAGAERRQGP